MKLSSCRGRECAIPGVAAVTNALFKTPVGALARGIEPPIRAQRAP